MSYPYTNLPPMQKIEALRAQIQVMEWESVTGETPTWYCWNEIGRMENEIEDLQMIIADSLIGSTRAGMRA